MLKNSAYKSIDMCQCNRMYDQHFDMIGKIAPGDLDDKSCIVSSFRVGT